MNPKIPLDLIVDHSVTIDVAGVPGAAQRNLSSSSSATASATRSCAGRRGVRRIARRAPGNGICHQINLERLAKVVWTSEEADGTYAYPDAIVGMDSHTAMISSLGVLGWGVGGIEAATAMLGEPLGLQIPRVFGCRLVGRLRAGVTTTDLVLTVAQRLRAKGVVGGFVEFCGPGVASLALPERSTLSNMCPEYGATTTYFPIDAETLRIDADGQGPRSRCARRAEPAGTSRLHRRRRDRPRHGRAEAADTTAAGPRGAVAAAAATPPAARTLPQRADAEHKGAAAHGVVMAIKRTNTSNPVDGGLLAQLARGLTRNPGEDVARPGRTSRITRAAGLQDCSTHSASSSPDSDVDLHGHPARSPTTSRARQFRSDRHRGAVGQP